MELFLSINLVCIDTHSSKTPSLLDLQYTKKHNKFHFQQTNFHM